MAGFNELAAAAIAGAFGFGMIWAILTGLKPFLAEKMEIPEGRVGRWISAAQLALIPFVFFSGLILDYWGTRGMLIAGALLAGLALFGLSLSRDVWMTGLSLAMTAAGASALSVGSIALMPRAFFGANAASANLGLVFVPLAALITSSLTPLILGRLEIRRALSLLALISLAPAFVVTMTSSAAFPPAPDVAESGSVLGNPVLWLLSLAFLLYGLIEGALGSWASTYLMQLGFSERRAGLLVSCFWLIFIASRLLAAFLEYSLLPNADPWILILLAGLAAVTVGGLAGTRDGDHAVLWLMLTGLTLGPIFPNLVGVLYRHFAEGEIGTAYGAMFLLGGAGSLLLPPVMSEYARRTSIRTALRLPTVISLVLAGGSLVIALVK